MKFKFGNKKTLLMILAIPFATASAGVMRHVLPCIGLVTLEPREMAVDFDNNILWYKNLAGQLVNMAEGTHVDREVHEPFIVEDLDGFTVKAGGVVQVDDGRDVTFNSDYRVDFNTLNTSLVSTGWISYYVYPGVNGTPVLVDGNSTVPLGSRYLGSVYIRHASGFECGTPEPGFPPLPDCLKGIPMRKQGHKYSYQLDANTSQAADICTISNLPNNAKRVQFQLDSGSLSVIYGSTNAGALTKSYTGTFWLPIIFQVTRIPTCVSSGLRMLGHEEEVTNYE